MTLRRYAPLALAALATVGCAPDIEERANATTVEYAVFNPSASQIPLPNDIAIQSFLGNPTYAALPCTFFDTVDPTQKTKGLCAYARAGGFPAAYSLASIQIQFLTGTLGADGTIAYAPSPFDVASIDLADLATPGAANVAVVDATLFSGWVLALASNPLTPPPAGLLVPVGVAPFDALTGTLSIYPTVSAIDPTPGAWTAGHKYVAIVRGYGSGVLTDAADTYDAMPTLYILREAVIGDLDLSLVENQGLFPGTPAEKMAAGTQLEPLRVGYQGVQQITQGLAALGIVIPFGELVSMQSFQITPGGTVTVGDGAAEPTGGALTGGATAALDAFTVQSSMGTATIMAVSVDLTDDGVAVAALSVNAAPDCGAATTLGSLSAAAGGTGIRTIPLTISASATLTTATPLWICATAAAATGTVTGTVAAVTAFPGTGYTSATNDATSATLNVTP